MTAREGIQDAGAVADAIVFETHRDHEDWLERLRLFPGYMDQTIALMREGIAAGMLHPSVVMRRVPDQIRRQIVAVPEQSLFFKPFLRMPAGISESVRRDLEEAARDRISAGVVPAYRRFLEFFESEYLPACPEEIGIWQLPDGRDLYRFFTRKFTTTDLTPEEIHEIGLREVARIRDEMGRVIEAIGFRGTFPEFLADLRTNPRFYFTDDAPLLAAYRETCAGRRAIAPAVRPTAPGLVRHPARPEQHRPGHDDRLLPAPVGRRQATRGRISSTCTAPRSGRSTRSRRRRSTRPYPDTISRSDSPPSWTACRPSVATRPREITPDTSRAGRYTPSRWAQSWVATPTPIRSAASSLTTCGGPFALSSIRAFTRSAGRASRAIEYFRQNAAKTAHDIENEVDRYIAWPGQALAYKIGELHIRQLRARAEAALGSAFDVRTFHDVVLNQGDLPLDALAAQVERWVEAEGRADL